MCKHTFGYQNLQLWILYKIWYDKWKCNNKCSNLKGETYEVHSKQLPWRNIKGILHKKHCGFIRKMQWYKSPWFDKEITWKEYLTFGWYYSIYLHRVCISSQLPTWMCCRYASLEWCLPGYHSFFVLLQYKPQK